jgi:hypothetical protein
LLYFRLFIFDGLGNLVDLTDGINEFNTHLINYPPARIFIQMSALPIPQPMQPWQDIARELARETNRERVVELSEELNRAVDEQLHHKPVAQA